jgi:plasmid stabilization system protein ParE
MAFNVRITREAELDMTETFNWRSENISVEAAAQWYNGVMDKIHSLEEMPRRCGLAPENEHFEDEIRQLLYGKRGSQYRILFSISGETVWVLHVLHSSHDTLRP